MVAFFTIYELFDVIVMTLALGFIFKDVFSKPQEEDYDPLTAKRYSFLNWADFKFAIIVTGPAILLHELGHKFVAIALGLYAQFHAAYMWLGLGVILKLVGAPLVFFVPAYVSHSAAALPWQSALIAFAGPFVNLVLWLGSWYVLKNAKKLSRPQFVLISLTKRINMFLFIFNMIPIPPFDGGHVVMGLWQTFF